MDTAFNKVIYRIGKRYGNHLEQVPNEALPHFEGQLSDFLDDTELAAVAGLQGEVVMIYQSLQGVRHCLRVYFEAGTFEVQGTPGLVGYTLHLDIRD